MKNIFHTATGALLLSTALAFVSSTPPALAQTPAAIKNVDEKGRSPYMQFQARSCPGGGNAVCDIVFPAVPAGKRLVVEHVNGSVAFATSGVRIASLLIPNGIMHLPLRAMDPKVTNEQNLLLVNEHTLAFFESGQSPIFHVVVNNGSDVPFLTASVSGYLVDLQQ